MTALDRLERLPGFSFLPLEIPACRAADAEGKAGLGPETATDPSFQYTNIVFLGLFSMPGVLNICEFDCCPAGWFLLAPFSLCEQWLQSHLWQRDKAACETK